jgi:hypothetical protein
VLIIFLNCFNESNLSVNLSPSDSDYCARAMMKRGHSYCEATMPLVRIWCRVFTVHGSYFRVALFIILLGVLIDTGVQLGSQHV